MMRDAFDRSFLRLRVTELDRKRKSDTIGEIKRQNQQIDSRNECEHNEAKSNQKIHLRYHTVGYNEQMQLKFVQCMCVWVRTVGACVYDYTSQWLWSMLHFFRLCNYNWLLININLLPSRFVWVLISFRSIRTLSCDDIDPFSFFESMGQNQF